MLFVMGISGLFLLQSMISAASVFTFKMYIKSETALSFFFFFKPVA